MKKLILFLLAFVICNQLVLAQDCSSNCPENGSTYLGSGLGNKDNGRNNTFVGSFAGFLNNRSNNAFFGQNAGFANLGFRNSFFGSFAGESPLASEANDNSFFGYRTGRNNGTGSNNIFFGSFAGESNTTGSRNVFLGRSAGASNRDGFSNVFIGFRAGYRETGSNKLYIANDSTDTPLIYGEFDNNLLRINGNLEITGDLLGINISLSELEGITLDEANSNSFVGNNSGLNTTPDSNPNNGIGQFNSFFGQDAGRDNTRGQENSFFGSRAGQNNTIGSQNTFIGQAAGRFNTTGSFNGFLGENAGVNNTIGSFNTFVGQVAGHDNTTGSQNAFFGQNAGLRNRTGEFNTFVGQAAGIFNISGNRNAFFGQGAGAFNNNSRNAFFGQGAGTNNQTGSGNVFLGYQAGFNEMESNKLYIANDSTDTPLIYGEFDNKILCINGDLKVRGETELEGVKLNEDNTCVGLQAGTSLMPTSKDGIGNAFFGFRSGQSTTTGRQNSFFGQRAGMRNEMGQFNAFFGFNAGVDNTTGSENSFFGRGSGNENTTGRFNSFFGFNAGGGNTIGDGNSFFGAETGRKTTEGRNNSFFGVGAGFENIMGEHNSFFGRSAGLNNQTGSGNVFLGYQAGLNELGSNKLFIANDSTENPLIYGDFKLGRIGINQGSPLVEFHIKGKDQNNTITTLFIEPEEWNSLGDIAQIRLGDPFHFIKAENRVGMTLGDFNGIFFQTGGRNLQTRMLIDFDGNVGIGTISPTATLHNKGTFRLEDLPSGTGQNLVIDKEGNVAIDNSVGIRETQLEKEVTELKARLAQLEAIISKFEDSTKQSTSAKLYQNVPNPFSKATEIKFFIPSEASQATLFIYDMQGTQIKKVNLTQRGESKISLQAGTLRAGIYHYALVVDGQEAAMQRMMITD